MPSAVDVLVIGAGPSGLAFAIEATRLGLAVRIVDKSPDAAKESRAIGINPRSLDMLEPSGVTERLLSEGVRVRGARFVAEGATLGMIDITRLKHRFNFLLALPQNHTERVLYTRLAEMGVEVERGVECVGVERNAESATALLRGPKGEERAAAPWIIGADGAHSVVRKQLGLDFPGAAYPFRWSLADVDLAGPPDDMGQVKLERHLPVLISIPIARQRFRLISTAPNLLARIPPDWKPGAVHWQAEFTVSHRHVARMGEGRVWLIGDASAIHSPAGGRGMNRGFEDAVTLAARIKAGDFGDWAEKRLARGASTIRESDALQRTATASGSAAWWTRKLLLPVMLSIPPVHDALVRRFAGL
jgi:2-polyprenyl-6-methoxyphenol hydroxylase-like FAD-dependent oxidoreductase